MEHFFKQEEEMYKETRARNHDHTGYVTLVN